MCRPYSCKRVPHLCVIGTSIEHDLPMVHVMLAEITVSHCILVAEDWFVYKPFFSSWFLSADWSNRYELQVLSG